MALSATSIQAASCRPPGRPHSSQVGDLTRAGRPARDCSRLGAAVELAPGVQHPAGERDAAAVAEGEGSAGDPGGVRGQAVEERGGLVRVGQRRPDDPGRYVDARSEGMRGRRTRSPQHRYPPRLILTQSALAHQGR